MKYLITSLFYLSSLFGPTAFAKSQKTPLSTEVNKILHLRLHTFVKLMNDAVQKQTPEEAFKILGAHHKSTDRESYLRVLSLMQNKKVKFRKVHKGVLIVTPSEKIAVEIVDYVTFQFRINGKDFQYNPAIGFGANVNQIGSMLSRKQTSFFSFFISEAHAVVPLAVLGWALFAGGSAAFVTDTFASPGANDIANAANKDVLLKIKELEVTYKDRADQCENDLGQTYGMGSSQLTGLSSVKVVGALIEGLNAELYDEWFNGKKPINYERYGCKAYDGVHGIRNRRLVGISPIAGHGRVLSKLCSEQNRLNTCFEELEGVMRENNVQVNDLSGPDQGGPYQDIVEDYKQLHDASRR